MVKKLRTEDEVLAEFLEALSLDWSSLKVNLDTLKLVRDLLNSLEAFRDLIGAETWARVLLVFGKLDYIESLKGTQAGDYSFVGSARNQERRAALNDIIGLLTDDSDGTALPAVIATELRQSSGRPTFNVEVPGGQTLPTTEQVRALKPR